MDKGNYKNGKKEGSWVGYYDNGELRYSVNFKNGDWEVGSYNGQGTFTYVNFLINSSLLTLQQQSIYYDIYYKVLSDIKCP